MIARHGHVVCFSGCITYTEFASINGDRVFSQSAEQFTFFSIFVFLDQEDGGVRNASVAHTGLSLGKQTSKKPNSRRRELEST